MLRRAGLIFAFFFWIAGMARAQTVPVFREALEQRQADSFQVLVFHRGTLTVEQEDALRSLEPTEGERANVRVRRVNLEKKWPPELAAFANSVPPVERAWLMARFPAANGIRAPFLSAPFYAETLQSLVESPVRSELAQWLIGGECAVWLLLESGDPAADDAAEKRLQESLSRLTGSNTEESPAFSLMRVARDDPAEARLVAMLLRCEAGLEEVEEPVVFPVFGRGRVLPALIGEGIRYEAIESVAAFLTGESASSTMKALPGVDLLLKADWDSAVKAPPALEETPPAPPRAIAPDKPAEKKPPKKKADAGGKRWPWVVVVMALLVAGGLLARHLKVGRSS